MKRVVIILLLSVYFLSFSKEYEVVDAHGVTREYTRSYNRIISLYPAHTEVLMGIGAKDKLVGSVEVEGEVLPTNTQVFTLNDSIEKYIALNPDLVIVRPFVEAKNKKLIEMLRARGVEVISLHPKTSFELYNYWLTLGMISGEESGANRYLKEYKKRYAELKSRALPNISVFFEAKGGRRTYTSSEDSIASYVLRSAGVENIIEKKSLRSSSIVLVDKEELILKGREAEVYIAQKGVMNRVTKKIIEQRSGSDYIKAVKDKQILIVDERIMSRPTASLLDGIEKIINGIEGMGLKR